ncbi:hypothetical protein MPTK1_3g03790 [Marchantia polymorpha subsp. ruderalis]|uniref:Uncharacterized protein n=2 Tax=Marchantia polymorpha TaxID=3197 RepID=A0AAF6AX57_MARPO|nr:hypothetical protein MARPO_0022s0152 [Marchantia polymorpha]BBN04341.1 hypothetical protein Mp_3g03790 [Marchantia polymorpha subsp. ruderalis]|eukprot:PTQ44063.1 hypothetical protein MARPO_0022s0152 [Marchantia polymorpha]
MKNIRHLKYSPSGHLVAAANSREIVLIDAYTWKVSAILKGHTGVVTTLAWSSDSMYVASAGADGAIYAWFLDGGHRYLEYVIKGSIHTCLLFDPARTCIISCGPTLPIRVIDTDKKVGLSYGREFKFLPEILATSSELEPDDSPPGSECSSVQGTSKGSQRGSIQESHRGSVRGSIQESHRGSVQGSIHESHRGSFHDSHRGSVQGVHKGDAQGNIHESHRGSIHDSHRGSVQDSHRGSVQDSQRGSGQRGRTQESYLGSQRGSVHGSHRGSLQESQRGSVQGTHRGSLLEIQRERAERSNRGSSENVLETSTYAAKAPEKVQERVEAKKGDGTNLEGSWVQHRYRSNCIFELTLEKPVNFIVGLFKKGLLITAAPNGDLRLYAYPFSRDKPNLLKEVILFPSGEITGLGLDVERSLIFASSNSGALFVAAVEQDIVGAKEEDADGYETPPPEVPPPDMPLINLYLTDAGSDAHNLLLERDEVDEMKHDLIEFKVKMAREAKDAYFKHQRDELDWACEMKERETAFLAREKDYIVKVKILEHNLHTAVSEKEATIQSLLNAHSETTQQLQDYFQDKLAQELDRSHISRKQAQKDRTTLENEMRSKENIYLEKLVALERQLEDAEARADERVHKVREECNKEIEHYKLEMEEDLLISDDELNKAFEKLNHDVSAEKDRADSIYHSLMAEKRNVMHIEKQMKEMEEAHIAHVTTIEKLNKEVGVLKKLATELDFEKRTLRQVLIETEEKSQHLVSERKDQETKTVVRDFKIKQLKKVEGPLKEATAELRSKLREMESHQLGHVLEMKRQGLVAAALRAKIQNLEEEAEELENQLHERDSYVNMFTQALCRLVQEHEVAEWPQLTKQLYFTYVKDVHRTAVAEGSDTYTHLLHQRENLEKFVAILKREIARSEERNWNDSRHYMQQNIDLLHEFGEAQRNVRRLAFLSQKYQGEMAYWKSIAAKKCPSVFSAARASLVSPMLDQRSSSISRCSKNTPWAKHRQTTSAHVTGDSAGSNSSRRGSRTSTASALQQAKFESALLHDAERVREQSRSSTPLANIVKPYAHRGSVPQAASLRYSFTQQLLGEQRQWSSSSELPDEIDRAKMLALNIEVIDLRKKIATKDKEILRLTRDQRKVSGDYLPRSRSASILVHAPVDDATAIPAAQDPTTAAAMPLPRRPSTAAAPRRRSSSRSRLESPGGVGVGVGAGAGSTTDLAQKFPQENEIISMDSSAGITTPSSATDAAEQEQGRGEPMSAIALLEEHRAIAMAAQAGKAGKRKSVTLQVEEPSASGDRRASGGAGERERERRGSIMAALTERRASVAAAAEQVQRRVSSIAPAIAPVVAAAPITKERRPSAERRRSATPPPAAPAADAADAPPPTPVAPIEGQGVSTISSSSSSAQPDEVVVSAPVAVEENAPLSAEVSTPAQEVVQDETIQPSNATESVDTENSKQLPSSEI